ncbi:hypothetical protein Hanom_Chr00s001232g01677091 [Helianthus anomalus]
MSQAGRTPGGGGSVSVTSRCGSSSLSRIIHRSRHHLQHLHRQHSPVTGCVSWP